MGLINLRSYLTLPYLTLPYLTLPYLTAILLSGCATSVPELDQAPSSEIDLAPVEPKIDPNRDRANVDVAEHDFGPILAEGQVLEHDFVLSNPTDRPIHLLRASALVPCCSAIGPLPEFIPAGGTVEVPVRFKPGYQGGRRGVEFVLRTDDPERPVRRLAITASLTPALEIVVQNDSDRTVPVRHPGRQAITITTRRLEEQGRTLPDEIDVSPPIEVALDGPARESRTTEGVLESSQDVIVHIPASEDIGQYRGELSLRWSDGLMRTHPIAWRVIPPIRASPPALTVAPDAERTSLEITLRSIEHSFRVKGVSGPHFAGLATPLPQDQAREHTLRLNIKPEAGVSGRASEIRIETDHPDQPVVSVSVLVLHQKKGANQ